MNVRVSFKNFRSSIPLQLHAQSKSEKLAKFLPQNAKLDWSLSVEKKNRIAHCKITSPTQTFISEAIAFEMEEAIDTVVDKLEIQLRKNKEKRIDQMQEPASVDSIPSAA
ncbi:MAG: ribosome-associated translation inhibitor RaiA [Bdellovibrionales bacterium]|nr:ribosome-associated translation inhibitor RaiA [Bdellovibrionales bacterium]